MFVEKHLKSYKRYQYNDDYTYYFVVIDNRGNPTFLQPRDLHPRFVIKHKLRLICLIYTADEIISSTRGPLLHCQQSKHERRDVSR